MFINTLFNEMRSIGENLTPTFSEMVINCHTTSVECPDEWDSISKKKNVVYCFVDTDSCECIYIGKTGMEFRNRFYQHINVSHNKVLREYMQNKLNSLALNVYVLDDYRDCSFLESYLIWTYCPKGNIESNRKEKNRGRHLPLDIGIKNSIIQDVASGQSKSSVARKHKVSLPTVYRHLAKAEQK